MKPCQAPPKSKLKLLVIPGKHFGKEGRMVRSAMGVTKAAYCWIVGWKVLNKECPWWCGDVGE